MNFKKLLKDEKTIFTMSFIWGMAFAVLILRKCMDGYCVVIHGPEKKEIEGNVFKVDGKCYKFNTEVTKCERK